MPGTNYRKCKICKQAFIKYYIPGRRLSRMCHKCRHLSLLKSRGFNSVELQVKAQEARKKSLYCRIQYAKINKLTMAHAQELRRISNEVLTESIKSFFHAMPEIRANLKVLSIIFNVSTRTIRRHIDLRNEKYIKYRQLS